MSDTDGLGPVGWHSGRWIQMLFCSRVRIRSSTREALKWGKEVTRDGRKIIPEDSSLSTTEPILVRVCLQLLA